MRRATTHATPNGSTGSDGTGRIVVVALFTPLVLLLLVAAMTWRSERRVAAAADRIVHDYAAIAVWQYARRANVALHDEAMRAFSGFPAAARQPRGSRTEGEPRMAAPPTRAARSPSLRERSLLTFTYDPATGRLDAAGDSAGALTLPMVRRRAQAAARAASMADEPHRLLFDSADGRSYALALLVTRSGEGRAANVQGVVVEAASLRPVFARVLREPLLLPAVSGLGAGVHDALALRVARPDGAVVFATDRRIGRTAATDTAGLQAGELRVTLDLPPQLARELLVGAGQGSQLPSLGLMIVAAGVLAVIGLVQHSRSRALARARTRFVANASHELRTPLAQISMFAETLHLGRERSEEERRQFAGIVLAEARRMTALVENVLRFSRAGQSPVELRPRPHDVAPLLARAADAFAPIASAADVRVGVSAPAGVRARVDPAAFQQIMLNLLDNAVKHGRGGRVDVGARLEEDWVTVTVDDGGPGVPAEWRARVFEPFAQVAGRGVTGTGLGLAIVRDLVAAHGGRVWIDESSLGGARVTFALPTARDASGPVAAASDVRPVPA